MTMITPSYLGETIEYSSLHACRSTLEDPTVIFLQVALIGAFFSIIPIVPVAVRLVVRSPLVAVSVIPILCSPRAANRCRHDNCSAQQTHSEQSISVTHRFTLLLGFIRQQPVLVLGCLRRAIGSCVVLNSFREVLTLGRFVGISG